MRKTLLFLSLTLLVILAGCKPLGLNNCTKTGLVPGGNYMIVYNASPDPRIIRYRTADSNGTFSIPSHGYNCTTLQPYLLTNSNLSLSASPSSVYLPSPPSTATVTGQSFDSTYGMPKVDYIDSDGFMIGSVYASSVTGGGTSLQATVPDLSYAYSGTYLVRVTNKTSSGQYVHVVGMATMTAWGRDRVDSDGDGWYDDEDCDPYDPYLTNNCGGEVCGGGQEPIYVCP